MSWISEQDPSATPVLRAMSLNPEAMRASMALDEAVAAGHSALTRVQEEAIATAVSVAVHCRY